MHQLVNLLLPQLVVSLIIMCSQVRKKWRREYIEARNFSQEEMRYTQFNHKSWDKSLQNFVNLTSWFSSPWKRLKCSLVRTVPLRWLQMSWSWDQFKNWVKSKQRRLLTSSNRYHYCKFKVACAEYFITLLVTARLWKPTLIWMCQFLLVTDYLHQHHSFMHFIVLRRSWQLKKKRLFIIILYVVMCKSKLQDQFPGWRNCITKLTISTETCRDVKTNLRVGSIYGLMHNLHTANTLS